MELSNMYIRKLGNASSPNSSLIWSLKCNFGNRFRDDFWNDVWNALRSCTSEMNLEMSSGKTLEMISEFISKMMSKMISEIALPLHFQPFNYLARARMSKKKLSLSITLGCFSVLHQKIEIWILCACAKTKHNPKKKHKTLVLH